VEQDIEQAAFNYHPLLMSISIAALMTEGTPASPGLTAVGIPATPFFGARP